MKEFELRKQFEGAANTERFAPIQAVDPTQQMRANQQIEQQNMQRSLDAAVRDMQQQEDAMRIAKDMELQQLQGFSKTLMETLSTAAKGYQQNQADKFFAEGMADVTKMRAMHPDFDEQEAALKADDAAFQSGVDKLAEQGLAPDVVARMRSLSGYAAYGYKRGVATGYGDSYSAFVDKAFAEDNVTEITLDGVTFTPATAVGADQKMAALAVIQTQFRRQNALEEISPGMLNKYVMPQMREKEKNFELSVRSAELKEQQQSQRSTALTNLGTEIRLLDTANPQSLNNSYFQDTMDALRRAGMTATDARKAIFTHIIALQSYDREFRITAEQADLVLASSNNYMGKPWKQVFASELGTARQDALKQRLQLDELADAENLQNREDWTDGVLEDLKRFGAAPEVKIKELIDYSQEEYGGVDERLTNYLENSTREAADLQDQKDRADILIRSGDFTVTEFNKSEYSLLHGNKDYADAAKRITEMYGMGGRNNAKLQKYEDGVKGAIKTALIDDGQIPRDLSGQSIVVADYAIADLHARAQVILMDPKAPENMTLQQAYQQAMLQISEEIANGKTGVYQRTGKGSQTKFENPLFNPRSDLSRESQSDVARNIRNVAFDKGRAGLIKNTGGIFTDADKEELSDPSQPRGAGYMKLRRYVEEHNLRHKDDPLTFDEAKSLLLDPNGKLPKKDAYEGTAALNGHMNLLTSPTPNRVNRIGVYGGHLPAHIRTSPSGFHDVSRASVDYGLPEAVAPLAGIIYQGIGMSDDYETPHQEIKALAETLSGIPEVVNAATPGEAIRAYREHGDFESQQDADEFVADAMQRLQEHSIPPEVPYINKPLIEGRPFSNPAVMGAAAKEFLTGNTGVGTGEHVHVSLFNARGQNLDPSSVLGRLLVNGEPLADVYEMTSGYGPRIHPVYGVRKFHNGIDFATPKNTRISVSGAEYIETRVDSGGGGVISIYALPDGSEIVLMHGSRANLK